jgi:hypothetical protein
MRASCAIAASLVVILSINNSLLIGARTYYTTPRYGSGISDQQVTTAARIAGDATADVA